MIPIFIIRKVLLSLVPLILFYLLRKIGKRKKSRRKSHPFDFDKEKIVDGEIVDESSANRS